MVLLSRNKIRRHASLFPSEDYKLGYEFSRIDGEALTRMEPREKSLELLLSVDTLLSKEFYNGLYSRCTISPKTAEKTQKPRFKLYHLKISYCEQDEMIDWR